MLIEVHSLDLTSNIAEFCVYIFQWNLYKTPNCIYVLYSGFFPTTLKTNQNTCIHMRTVCYIIMQFSVFHSFGPVFCLVKLCRC